MKITFGLKKIIMATALALSGMAFSQVGINNTDPKATLDVTAKTTDGSKPEGLIAPRLTGDQIRGKNAQYTADQTGTIVYATSADTAPAGKTASITAAGYYYFDGSVWQKVGGGSGGSGANDWYAAGGTTDALGNKTSDIYRTGSVGVGSDQNISPYAKFQITSTNQGLLLPRINLTSATMDLNPDGDNNVSNQPAGLMVYNTGGNLDKGIYYWDGANWMVPGKKNGMVDFSDCSSIKVSGVYMTESSINNQVVKINVPVKVTALGDYSYTAVANGINFSATGSFTSLGSQTVTLVPVSGTPTSTASGSYQATVTIAPTKNGGTAGVTCSGISVSFLARSGARMKIVYFGGTYGSTLAPATTSASTRTGQWLTGVAMSPNPNGTAPAHTALYYSGTAAIDLVSLTTSTGPAALQDALNTASIVYVGGEVGLSSSQSSLIEQWLKAGKGYFITMNDTATANPICNDLGYYLEDGASVNSQTANTGSFPQLFSQTAPNDAPYPIGDGLSVGYQGSAAAYITSNSGSKFLVSTGTTVRNTGFIDLSGGAFIIGDKFGYDSGTTLYNTNQILIDLFAYMLKNAPVYTTAP